MISTSKSSRLGADGAPWELAWSSVAWELALADACLRMVWTLMEVGAPALLKRVITSRVLC